MTLSVSAEGQAFAESFRANCQVAGRDYLVFVPPTRGETKMYPVRHWRVLAAGLAKRIPIALVGTAGDAEMCSRIARSAGPGVINLAGQTTIPQMVGLIAGSACVVCSDSAAQHIAQGVGADAVVLIGPTRPQRTGPILRGRCVIAPVPCQGCLRRTCRHVTCMQAIDPQSVAAAVEESLAGRNETCHTAT